MSTPDSQSQEFNSSWGHIGGIHRIPLATVLALSFYPCPYSGPTPTLLFYSTPTHHINFTPGPCKPWPARRKIPCPTNPVIKMSWRSSTRCAWRYLATCAFLPDAVSKIEPFQFRNWSFRTRLATPARGTRSSERPKRSTTWPLAHLETWPRPLSTRVKPCCTSFRHRAFWLGPPSGGINIFKCQFLTSLCCDCSKIGAYSPSYESVPSPICPIPSFILFYHMS